MLMPGQVLAHPTQAQAQAHPGVFPLSPLIAVQPVQPLPKPLGEPPYHYDLESVLPGITQQAASNGQLVFHTVGDTGGVKDPHFQLQVSAAMKQDLGLPSKQRPSFFYHLGDVIYFNGQVSEYYSQFYEPYNHYTAPIISIPGNHDGSPINNSQTSLDGWVRYFMTATPHVNPESQDAPRVTLSEPNVYFTLNCPFATIVGMYTNVPEGGSIDSLQQQWLTNEFATAPADKALIVALHHPIYSFDAYHSGSPRMADALQHAINDSRRLPNMVLTAHVHNYQRFEKQAVKGINTPFMVIGHGGYYNLHQLTAPPGTVDQATGAKLIAANDQLHGYATLTIDANSISGTMTLANATSAASQDAPAKVPASKHLGHKPKPKPKPAPGNAADSFSYTAAAQYVPQGVVVSL